MKKITLLFLMLFTASFWQVNAQFTEGFESGIPATWTVINNGSPNGWVQNTAPTGGAQEGSAVASITYSSSAHDDYLITPAITVSTGVNDLLSFYVKSRSGSYLEPYEVLLSTTDAMAASFNVTLQASSEAPGTWTENTFDLTTYNGQTIYIAIKATGTNEWQLFLDEFVSSAVPACSGPSSLTSTPSSLTETTLSWTAGGTETNWTVEYGATGFTQGSGTTMAATTNSLNVSGLTSGDSYDFYVQSNCGLSGNSSWEGPQTWVQPIQGDVISLPIAITPSAAGTGCTTAAFSYDFAANYSDSGLDGTCQTTNTGKDIFFSWTATTDGLLWNDIGGNPGVVVRNASDGSEVVCRATFADDDFILSGWAINDNLIIQVYDYGAAAVNPLSFCLEEYTLPPAPNCATAPMPADMATDVPTGNVTFSWTAPATGPTPTSYNLYAGETTGLEYGLIGNFTDTTAALTINANSLLLYWQVVPLNGAVEATGCDIWSFTTAAPPPAPANDLPTGAIDLTLDVGTSCGANAITGISIEGTTDSGVATPSCGSYTPTATNGDIWYKFVAPATGSVTLNTENVTTTSIAGAYYSGTPGSLNEEGCTEFGSGWPWSLTGLTAGATYYLRAWDYGNDQIGGFDLCGYYETCPTPSTLTAGSIMETSAELGWTENGTASSWNIELGASGFTPTGTATNFGVTNPFNATGLTHSTSYDFYVQADCGGGDTSDWVGPYTFFTTFAPLVPDDTNDFSTFPGPDWSEATGAFGSPTGATSTWAQDDYGNDAAHANGKSARVNIFGTNTDEYLISRAYDLSGATYYLNYEIALTDFNNSDPGALGSDDYLALLVTQDDGATWAEIERYDATTAITASRQPSSQTTLTGYGSNVRFAFYANSGATDDAEDVDLFIDNFAVTSAPLKVEENALEGFSIYPNPTKNEIFLKAQDAIQEITVYNLMGQKVLAAKPNVLDASLSLSELATGMYVVKVKVDGKLGSYRIVKQ